MVQRWATGLPLCGAVADGLSSLWHGDEGESSSVQLGVELLRNAGTVKALGTLGNALRTFFTVRGTRASGGQR